MSTICFTPRPRAALLCREVRVRSKRYLARLQGVLRGKDAFFCSPIFEPRFSFFLERSTTFHNFWFSEVIEREKVQRNSDYFRFRVSPVFEFRHFSNFAGFRISLRNPDIRIFTNWLFFRRTLCSFPLKFTLGRCVGHRSITVIYF